MLNQSKHSLLQTMPVLVFLASLSLASPQETEERVIKRNSWPNEPIEIFNLKYGDKTIAFDEEFLAEKEWVKDISFYVRNVSGKMITHFQISLLMPNRQPQKPSGLVSMVFHGDNTGLPDVKPTVRMMPGEVMHAVYSDQQYISFKNMRSRMGWSEVPQVTMTIERVMFEDDTSWSIGNIARSSTFNPMSWVAIGKEHLETRPSDSPVFSLKFANGSTVEIEQQADAPLLLSLLQIHARNPLKPQIDFLIQNRGDKSIRAFSIKYVDHSEKAESSNLVWDGLIPARSVMKPGQWQSLVFIHPQLAEPVERIILSVDFVEFEDKTTWGADTMKHADRFDGRRDGATAVRDRLLKILAIDGIAAVIRDLEKSDFDPIEPQGRSTQWVQAYHQGAKAVRERLQRAYKDGGATAVETEIQRPVTNLTY
ncbi:MAG: hypothetical protein L0226_13030 [Acidobacteria bacterium]|nr:hypothetical protein [Acidobacteriota bacterium]